MPAEPPIQVLKCLQRMALKKYTGLNVRRKKPHPFDITVLQI